jgi:hypothetical protein
MPTGGSTAEKHKHLDLGLDSYMLGMGVTVAGCRDLEVPGLDVALQLIETRADFTGLPGRNTRVEHIIHLL